ncbi:TPA: hypothetical protein ACIVE4_003652, partial [Salmonella enterica subsp. enterica serovar Hvittingfoss]
SMDNNNTETLNVDILSHAVTKKYDILNCTTPFSGEFYRRMFFIVREPCSFSIKVNVTGKIKRLKNRPYGYNYYAKNVTIVFGRRDNVNSDRVIGISGNANRRTK